MDFDVEFGIFEPINLRFDDLALLCATVLFALDNQFDDGVQVEAMVNNGRVDSRHLFCEPCECIFVGT